MGMTDKAQSLPPFAAPADTVKVTNHGSTSVFIAIVPKDRRTLASANSLEVKPGQTITAGAAKGGRHKEQE